MRRNYLTTLPLVLVLAFGVGTFACGDIVRSSSDQSDQHVRELIQQLGSQQYAIRKSAEDELRRLGRTAFDQLLFAQHDKNSEIQLAVRELLARLPIRWPSGDQPSIIEDITRNYSRLSSREKSLYASWLVRLEDGIGLPSLVRIVRFEPSDIVAKQAAMAVIEELDQEDAVQVDALQQAYRQLLAESKRTSAAWIGRFTQDLAKSTGDESNAHLPTWKEFAIQESKLQDTGRFDAFISAMLYQKWAEDAFEKNNKAAAAEAVKELISLRKSSAMLIIATSFWLIEHQQFDLFQEQIWDEFQELRESDPLFVYCNFVAKQKQGEIEEAKVAAEYAFNLTEDDEKFPQPFERASARYQVARLLEQKDFIEPAIREYRRLLGMERTWQTSELQTDAAEYFAELLHDRRRDREAADVLLSIVRLENGALLDGFEEDSSNISRMYYFRSEQHRQNGERAKQIEFLDKAVEANPTDADVLIAMHRLPRADKKWKERTSQLIARAVKTFDSRLQQLRAAGEFENRSSAATYLNQVAWLVSNTEGDFEKAVQQSRRSLELRPGSAGSLDTLGRAYFSTGDLENAVRYQSRAVRLQPNSHQIIRQLEEFQAKKNQTK